MIIISYIEFIYLFFYMEVNNWKFLKQLNISVLSNT